ncbi:MAG: protein kinase, partial [Myxococcota bacterium]
FIAKRTGPHGFYKRVALKRILPQYSKDPDFVAMFIDEARLAAHLEHPNIVQVFDFGELGGELVLAMELVVGTNVNRLLRHLSSRDQELPLDVVLHVASQTAHALSYAHRMRDDEGSPLNLVHRDVSPANVLLTHTGYVKLSDFGIARAAGYESRTDDGQVRGKLGYMSPEQVTGRPLDGKSDVFTLSTVFAEMLVGEPLFGSGRDLDVLLRIRDGDLSTLHKSPRRIPQDVLRVLRLGLCVDPSERPSAAQFARGIDEVIRRRGLIRGPTRLARLLARLNLIRGVSDGETSEDGGQARPTNLFDTNEVSTEEALLAEGAMDGSPAIYEVRLDQGVVGPLSFPSLVRLITGGQLVQSTPVSKKGRPYVRADRLAELTRFVTSPALQWRPEEILRASRRGHLSGGELLPVIHRIWIGGETGLLHLQNGERRKKVYFLEGRPDFVGSNDRSELLGEFLVREGYCLRMEVDMALALLERYDGRLGDALVGLGVLRPVELCRAIHGQIRHRIADAFAWRRGTWSFVPEALSHEETIPIAFSPGELLRDGASQVDEGELRSALHPLMDRPLLANPDAPLPVRAFRVPERWEELLQVRNPVSPRAALAVVDQPEIETLRAVFLGLACELLKAA